MIDAHPFVTKLNRFILGKADQSGSIAELNVSGFDFPTKLDILFGNIIQKQPLPPLVILTGNAGDGKSHLIFKIWLYLTQQTTFQQRSDGALPSLHQLDERELEEALRAFEKSFSGERADTVVEVENYLLVKDASAVHPAELKELLIQAFSRLLEPVSARDNKIALVSINEGVLRTQLKDIAVKHPSFAPSIQDVLRNLEESKGFFSLDEVQSKQRSPMTSDKEHQHSALVLNLNTRDLGERLLDDILNELAQAHLFIGMHTPCTTCPASNRCPIRFNMLILGDAEHPARRRIALLFKALNYMGLHITLREALSVLSFVLTGNLTCAQIQLAFQEQNEVEQPTLPGLGEQDPPLSHAQERFLLRVFPYLFFNGLFAQSIRYQEIIKLSQLLPLAPLGPALSEERVLFHLGLLDPAGFAAPSHDVSTSFAAATFSLLEDYRPPIIAYANDVKEHILRIDSEAFEVLRAVGQRMSAKGIPDVRWLRSLVITSKRHVYFFTSEEATALRHSMFFFYEDFNRVVDILKKLKRTHDDRAIISDARHTIVEALNQFQQPHTVGYGIRDTLELVQREHLVLFKRMPTTDFDLILATPLHNDYVEQTEARIRLIHKQSHTALDCDLLLYELMRRFVSGSLSFEGLEARVTDIENFLAKLRGAVVQGNEGDSYILVGKAITFSVDDGQIIVRRT